jgi:hypothetical protein
MLHHSRHIVPSLSLLRVIESHKNKSLRYGIAHVELQPPTVGCQCRASQQIREPDQRRPPLGSRFRASVANPWPTTSNWYSGYFLRLTAREFEGEPSDLCILSRGGRGRSSGRTAGLVFSAGALTELVGREEELELLLRRWSRAKIGEGQVVLLSGEPGIGKSRLTVTARTHRCGATHSLALLLLTAAHRQRALSDHQPDGACRRIYARRRRSSKAGQTRCRAGADLDLHRERRPVC